MKKIALLGYGWLGRHLNKHFQALGYPSPILMNRSKKEGVFPFELGQSEVSQQLQSELSDCDALIVCLPPSIGQNIYSQMGNHLISFWPKDKKLIFISSTGIFEDEQGEYFESSEPKLSSPRKELLSQAEHSIKTHYTHSSLIRSAGQVGPDRNPLHFLTKSGKSVQASQPINFIHSEDLCSIVELCLKNDIPLVHAVSPYHPTKKQYYTEKAEELSLPTPKFTYEDDCQRIISSEVLESFNYQFKKKKC